ncbi:YncE family protein [Amycolatopsis sp. FBCC-B4732]|uniref:YncE family protein n=1 Tax=Amycolatopsis sp. FBCC-B4732 TaxID=3079339 RepID=UPI001FF5E6AD|nr:YncE family protein [Amycolatopsis sp. FBCC-B4732]UOX88456.1 YncE family protein [Amycolatopsis sp. FBCC-B4732]
MRRIRVLLGSTLLVTACSTPAPPQLPPAAEPAVSPPVGRAPAGRTVRVGDLPEGIVADGVTHRVVVGVRNPDRLVLLDAGTGAVVASTTLPGHLRHLQLAAPGGPVLVPDETSDRLLTVSLPEGTVTGNTPAGSSPHDATRAADGRIFAANENGRSVVVVENCRVIHTFTDVTQPAVLAPVGNLVSLVDVRQNDLSVYDATTLTRVARLPAGAGPTHVVADRHGHLAVIDTRGDAVLTYDPATPAHTLSWLALPGTPYGVTYDPTRDRLWVTLTARNEVVGVDLSGTSPREIVRLPTVRQPNTVAVEPGTGTLFVTGTTGGVVEIIPAP